MTKAAASYGGDSCGHLTAVPELWVPWGEAGMGCLHPSAWLGATCRGCAHLCPPFPGETPPCPGAYIFSADVWLGIVVEVRGLGAIGVLVWSLWQGWELLPRKDSAAIHMCGILSGGRANLVGTLQKPGPA